MDASNPRPKLPLPWQVWHPSHGIRFSPPPSAPRLSTVAAVESKQDLLLHSQSHIEDQASYTISPLQTTTKDSASIAEKPEVSNSKPPEPPAPKEPDPTLGALPPDDPEYNTIPISSSAYQVSTPLFHAAKAAVPGTPESYWSHTLYREATTNKKVIVHYCKSIHTTERVLQTYFSDSTLIGLDIEWLTNASRHMGPKASVSLIQIASESRIALFHIALYSGSDIPSLVAPSLKRILEDATITKVGVAIKSDCTRLRNNLGISPRGLFELSHLYKLLAHHADRAQHGRINKKLVSLAVQTAQHLHLPMYKGESVRSSDWSRTLDLSQIRYAAGDSYAGVQLYLVMEEKRRRMVPRPPRPWHAELNLPIRVAEGVVEEVVVDGDDDEGDGDETVDGDGDGDVDAPLETPPPKQRPAKKAASPYPSYIKGVGLENLDASELDEARSPEEAPKPISEKADGVVEYPTLEEALKR